MPTRADAWALTEPGLASQRRGEGTMRALVVLDHTLPPPTVTAWLEREGLEPLGFVGTQADALDAVRRSHPDLVLIDLGLSHVSAVELRRRIEVESPSTKVLALVAVPDAGAGAATAGARLRAYLDDDPLCALTPRELEILRHLTAGATTKTVARKLHIAPNTVRSHVRSLLSKLQVHSRLEAVALANRHGVGLEVDGAPGPAQYGAGIRGVE